MNSNFCAFILSHGRPDKVKTYDTLLRHGYTGKVYIIIDNEDDTAELYIKRYGSKVIIFDKLAVSKTFDTCDNFNNRKTIVYARNACFDIAKGLDVEYFIQLDDDYTDFRFKINSKKDNINKKGIVNIDSTFNLLLKYFTSYRFSSIAFSQGGDFLGGKDGNAAKNPQLRKCMNSFICSTNRRFNFIGSINEDVNTYTSLASIGSVFLNIPFVALQQATTQKSSGGMSSAYVNSGTYVKSFYSVIASPSSVKVKLMISNHPRLHHSISWNNAVPCIIRESHKKVVSL